MPVTQERFAQGLTYDAYKAQMTRNRERLEHNERTIILDPSDVQWFVDLDQPLQVVVLTEDWCEPAIENIPVLVRLAAASRRLELRFFVREHNPDLMEQYRSAAGHHTIPTFVVLDQDFQDLGQWRERPAIIRDRLRTLLGNLWATNPAFAAVAPETPFPRLPEAARQQLLPALIAFRAETRELSDREVLRELRALVEHVHRQA